MVVHVNRCAIRFCHECSTFFVRSSLSMVIVDGQLKIPGAGYTEPSTLWQYCCLGLSNWPRNPPRYPKRLLFAGLRKILHDFGLVGRVDTTVTVIIRFKRHCTAALTLANFRHMAVHLHNNCIPKCNENLSNLTRHFLVLP